MEPGIESDGIPFFADQRVRQAIAYGTDRQTMTEEILYGEVQPLSSFLPSDHWAWNSETESLYTFDPEKAKELLAEAGWEDADGNGVVEAQSDLEGGYSCERGDWVVPEGTEFEVSFHTTTGNAMRQQLMTIFQANMSDIGIKINLDPLPGSVWFADDGPLSERRFQIGEYAWVAGPDPDQLSLYGGMNLYKFDPDVLGVEPGATGPILTAENLLNAKPDLLDDTDITVEMFYRGRAVDEDPDEDKLQFLKSDLPDGLKATEEDSSLGLLYPEQIQEEKDDFEGQNSPGWCDSDATQLMFDGQNVLGNEQRLPFYLDLQMIYAEQVPVVVLFQRVEVEAWVNGLCGPQRGPASYSSWNIETWYFGECEAE